MHESTGYDHASLQALFAGQEHHLAIRAVLSGAAHGQVFVDDAHNPRRAAIWVQHRVFLAGSLHDATSVAEMRELLTTEIAPAARARGDYAFGLYYPPAWHAHLAELLPDLAYTPLERQYYVAERIDQLAPWRERLPAGLRLAAVDAELLAQTALGNHARLAEEMCSEQPSVEEFLARSFGVCALDGDALGDGTLAGWCLSEYDCGGRCEVGIEVVEEYQRRGLGALLTLALCEEAARRGLHQVGWHCLASNAPSGATAAKAGLRLALEYSAAVLWLKTD